MLSYKLVYLKSCFISCATSSDEKGRHVRYGYNNNLALTEVKTMGLLSCELCL